MNKRNNNSENASPPQAEADAVVTTEEASTVTAVRDERDDRKSQSTQLVELANAAELFRDSDSEAYARLPVDEHFEIAGVRTKHFRRWIARAYYATSGKAASSQSIQDCLGTLEGKAAFEGAIRPVHVRVAGLDGNIYIDLCNSSWQVIEVSAAGWRVLDESPIAFRRAKAMLPLPAPVEGGSVNELREFVHLKDDEWKLFACWLVAALTPTGPYPVLNLQGDQGSGKSTASRIARALLDPNVAMLRSEPREPRDLMIASKNGWLIALDNLSGLSVWLSDCLCRLATGGGFSTRTLYENDEETIFDAQRPLIINGIDDVASRQDLLERCLLLNVPRIERHQRRPESELWTRFEEARPRVLGALLTALSSMLRNIGSMRLTNLPRMADFAVRATAAEQALGFERGAFMSAYEANRDSSNAVALDSLLVGKAVYDFALGIGSWSGTATELLTELDERLGDKGRWLKNWPKNAQALGCAIKRAAPNLRDAGVDVKVTRKGRSGSRAITLTCRPEQTGNSLSDSSVLSAAHESAGFRAPSADDLALTADKSMDRLSAEWSVIPARDGGSDDTDNADNEMQHYSSVCAVQEIDDVDEEVTFEVGDEDDDIAF
jgi:hypothetical protein